MAAEKEPTMRDWAEEQLDAEEPDLTMKRPKRKKQKLFPTDGRELD